MTRELIEFLAVFEFAHSDAIGISSYVYIENTKLGVSFEPKAQLPNFCQGD